MKQFTVILLLVTAIVAYNDLEIPYQAHSMNDLNLTLQELIKGVKNFKFDVSQATQESCEDNSSWNRDYSQCGYFGDFGMKTCCLALRGDCSQQPVFNYHFNTSDDMVRLISNPKHAFFLSKNTVIKKYQGTKYFAFNFQYNTKNAVFTTDFIYNFLKAIEVHDLDLKMMRYSFLRQQQIHIFECEKVTGSSGMISYYDQKCFVQQTCNEKEQYISQSDIILQSPYNGPRERNIQFNQESNNLDNYCKQGFPLYMKNNDIPIQLWEPSYQDSVYDIYNTFWSNRCFKLGIKDPKERFKITSNVNSENYAAFLQKANKTSPIQYVPPKHRFLNSSQSLIEYNNDIQITFVSRLNSISNQYELEMYDGISLKHSTRKAIIFEQQLIKLSSKGIYLFIETPSTLNVYKVISRKEIEQIKSVAKDSNYICSDIVLIDALPHLLISSLVNSNLQIQLFSLNTNLTLLTTVNLHIENVSAQGFKYVSAIYNNAQIVSIYSYESINPSNHVSEISFFYSAIDLTSSTSQFIKSSAPQHFGSNSSLKIYEYNGQLYFAQVSGNGSCWSGVFINNGDWCKCTLYLYEKFFNLRNIPHTITYMWGKVDDLIERIKSSSFINSCDKKIMTAKVYNGKNPNISVVRDKDNKPTAYVMMDYVHYDELPLLTTLFLGSNSYEEQYADYQNIHMTELISFDLVEYEIFDIPT